MSTEARVAALQSLLERVLTNAKLPRPWNGDAPQTDLAGDVDHDVGASAEPYGFDRAAFSAPDSITAHHLVLDPLTEEPSSETEVLESELEEVVTAPPPHDVDVAPLSATAREVSEETPRSRPMQPAPPSVRGLARPPTPLPPARLTPSDSSPLHDAVITHTETAPGGGRLENGFGLVPPPPRKPSALPDFHDEPTATGDPDEAEELLLAEQEEAQRQRVRFPTPPPGSAGAVGPYAPESSEVPTPPPLGPHTAREPIRPPSPTPFPAAEPAHMSATPRPDRDVPAAGPSRPVLELDLDLETPSAMPPPTTEAYPMAPAHDGAPSARAELDFDPAAFSDDGVKTDPPPASIGRADHIASFAPGFGAHRQPSLPDIDAIEQTALGSKPLQSDEMPAPESDVEERSPSSSRQLRDQVRPVDDRFDDFGPVGESEPPPESGEVPSQSHPQVGGAEEGLAAKADRSGEFSAPADGADRAFRDNNLEDATAEVHSLGRVDVIERTPDLVTREVVAVIGALAEADETFGSIVDASLALKW